MAGKKKNIELSDQVTKAKESDSIIVFKANRTLNKAEFNLLSDMIKEEGKKTGVKIILMPYSCEVGE